MNRRKTGAEWEAQAAEYLAANGMRIVEKNFRGRQGEIDVIGCHQGCLVFVEVKYRSSPEAGHALESVGYRKQCRICRTADYYRYLHGIGENVCVRYDVVGIQDGEIQWVQNAFSHIWGRQGR